MAPLDSDLGRTSGQLADMVEWWKVPLGPQQRSDSRSWVREGWDSFLYGLTQQNPELMGEAFKALGVSIGSDDFYETGFLFDDVREVIGIGQQGSVGSIADVDSLDDAGRYVLGTLGQGLASIAPVLSSVVVGGLATGGNPLGAMAGGLMTGSMLNMGETFKKLREEGVDPAEAADLAVALALPQGALDALGARFIAGPGKRKAAETVARYIGRRAGHGAAVEGATETLQEASREIAAVYATGEPKALERATSLVDAFIGGALVGGTISTGAGVAGARRREEEPPPSDDDFDTGTLDEEPDEAAAPAPAAPTAAPPTAGPAPDADAEGPFQEYSVRDLTLDPQRFQFKASDEQGSTGRFEGIQRWDTAASGVLMVWEDREGTPFVADGHQRVNFARRLVDEGKEDDIRLAARVYREEDGWTADDVKVEAAKTNILQDSGTSYDAARIIKLDPAKFEGLVGRRSVVARQGRDIARLSQKMIDFAVGADVQPAHAAIVGARVGEDDVLAQGLMEQLKRRNPPNQQQAGLIADMILDTRQADAVETDLFGDRVTLDSLLEEKAALVDVASRRAAEDARVFRTVMRNADLIEDTGENVLDEPANLDVSRRRDLASTLIRKRATARGDPISDAATAWAQRLKDREVDQNAAVTGFLRDVENVMAGKPVEQPAAAPAEEAPPVPSTWIGRKDGSPFKTRRAAELAGRQRPGHTPVEHEGGWYLAPEDAAPAEGERGGQEQPPGPDLLDAGGVAPAVPEPDAGGAEPAGGDRPASDGASVSAPAAPEGLGQAADTGRSGPDTGDAAPVEADGDAAGGTEADADDGAAVAGVSDAEQGDVEPASLQDLIDAANQVPTADGGPRVTVITIPEPEPEPAPDEVPTAEEITEAASEADPDPSDGQKEAGNYQKGHISLYGLDITIENPKGSERSGTGPDGERWSVEMPAHYGYIRRTEGADGDQVDAYIGEEPASQRVWIVDQVDAESGAFDEHKTFLAFPDLATVESTYDAAFDDGKGPQRRRAITEMSVDDFKTWLRDGDTTKPVAVDEAPSEADTAAQDEGVQDDADSAGTEGAAAGAPGGERPGTEESPADAGGPGELPPDADGGGSGSLPGDVEGERPEGAGAETGPDGGSERDGPDGDAGVLEPPGEPAAGGGAGGLAVEATNVQLTPEILAEARTPSEKIADNLTAIETANRIVAEQRQATPEEQAAMARYVGWGGLVDAFPNAEGKWKTSSLETAGQKLRTLLTEEEYETARQSTQYAHYTSETVIRRMWELVDRLGFTGGRILEPGMGIGHFAGLMPQRFATGSHYTGIEMDGISARIAKLLYPRRTTVKHEDFAYSTLPIERFDLAIGNPPFGDIRIEKDPDYRKYRFLLHDFFFAKSMDRVRPGGLMVFVTSAGTMNKQGKKARQYLHERAEFLGGIRLPGDAFEQNARTSVTTDVLVFQKRAPGEKPEADAAWIDTEVVALPNKEGGTTEGHVNKWFLENPGMVLGEQGFFDRLIANRYAVRSDGRDLDTAMGEALASFPADVFSPVAAEPAMDMETAGTRAAGSFYLKDGQLHIARVRTSYTSDGTRFRQVIGQPVKTGMKTTQGERSKKAIALLTDVVPVKDARQRVVAADLAGDDAAGATARKQLNESYDSFRKKYGPLSRKTVRVATPTPQQLERERERQQNDMEAEDQLYDQGSFSPPDGFYEMTLTERAAERAAQRQAYEAMEAHWDEGSFDPSQLELEDRVRYPTLEPLKGDPDFWNMMALEIENIDDPDNPAKAPIFDRPVLSPVKERKVDSARDAMWATMNELGRFDLEHAADLIKSHPDAVAAELGDAIYEDPAAVGVWRMQDEYLSGDVVTKLEEARDALATEPRFQRNVDALSKVQPTPLTFSQIDSDIGAPWVPVEVYQEFLSDVVGMQEPRVTFSQELGRWIVAGQGAHSQFRAAGVRVGDLVAMALQRKKPNFHRTVNGKREADTEKNGRASLAIGQLQEAWRLWIADAERADAAAATYNATFNRTVSRQYDGSWLETPGVMDGWQWRPHQLNAIARGLVEPDLYLNHVVGSGKTSTAAGIVMEARRLGLAGKAMVSVPKSVVEQFAREWMAHYPAARIIVPDVTDLSKERRAEMAARVAADPSLDAVILTHETLNRVQVTKTAEIEFLQERRAEAVAALQEQLREGKLSQKQYQKKLEQWDNRIAGVLHDQDRDDGDALESWGVDMLIVDEAHAFKKLDFVTVQDRIAGIDPKGSQRAIDLQLKTHTLRKAGGRTVFMSGTPVSNTLAELYTIQRFLQPDRLRQLGIQSFDAWANMFGKAKTEPEPTADGGFTMRTRFDEFVNVGDLSALVSEVVDTYTGEQLAEKVLLPSVYGGGEELVAVKPSSALQRYKTQVLGPMLSAVTGQRAKKGQENILTVELRGMLSATDLRLVDGDAQNDERNKLNTMINNVVDVWRETVDTPFYEPAPDGSLTYADKPAFRGPATQMVFIDQGLSGTTYSGFSAADWTMRELVRLGIPRAEIADIRNHDSPQARRRLFNRMNAGEVRVLIGSSAKMGVGVNAQRRLIAAHNLSPVWRPSDHIQRVGRILRQGNMNPQVRIFNYSTVESYDAKKWQTMRRKMDFLASIWRNDRSIRRVQDIADNPYAEIQAVVANNPLLIRREELRAEQEKLRQKITGWESARRMARTSASRYRQWAADERKLLEELDRDIATAQDRTGDNFEVTIDGKVIKDREQAYKRMQALRTRAVRDSRSMWEIGEFAGFPMLVTVHYEDGKIRPYFVLQTESKDRTFTGSGEISQVFGAMTRALGTLKGERAKLPGSIKDLDRQMVAAEEQLQRYEGEPEDAPRLREIQTDLESIQRTMESLARAEGAALAGGIESAPDEEALGMGTPALRKAIQPVLSQWDAARMPEVVVMRSDEPTPWNMPEEMAERLSVAREDEDAEGIYIDSSRPDMKAAVVLFSDRIEDTAQAERVLAHEVIGHASIKQMLGTGYVPFLDGVAALESRSPQIAAIGRAVREDYEGAPESVIAAEIVARMAEKPPIIGHRLATAVRRWLAKIGINLRFGTGELLEVIAKAERRLRPGEPDGTAGATDIQYRQTWAFSEFERDVNRGPAAMLSRRSRGAYVDPRGSVRPLDSLLRLMVGPLGVRNELGEWKGAPRVKEASARLIRDAEFNEDGWLGGLNPILNAARNAWLDRHGVPDDVKTAERRAQGHEAHIMDQLAALMGPIMEAKLTGAEAAALQEILEGQPATDERLGTLAKPVRDAIDALGQEAVELGLLSWETWRANLGQYLHRSYAKYEADAPGVVKWGRRLRRRVNGGAGIRGDEFKRRGIQYTVQGGESRLLRDVPEDPGELAPLAKGEDWLKVAKTEQNWRILTRIADTGKVSKLVYWPTSIPLPGAFTRSNWQDRGTFKLLKDNGRLRLRRDYTKAERAEMGEVRDARYNIIRTFELLARDLSRGKLFQDLAADSRYFRQAPPEDARVIDGQEVRAAGVTLGMDDWVRIPDSLIPKSRTRRWGALAGGYVRAPIWRDLNQWESMQDRNTWNYILRQYKKNKTARSLSVHMNNVMSNVVMAYLQDLSVNDIRRAVKEYVNKGQVYQELRDYGGLTASWAANELDRSEIRKTMRVALDEYEGPKGPMKKGLFAAWDWWRWFDDKMVGVYRAEDEVFRVASYMRDRALGMPQQEAATRATEGFLNYDIRAPLPNWLRRNVLPFFSYSYRVVPTLAGHIVSRPWKLLGLVGLGYLHIHLVEALMGDEAEDLVLTEREKGSTWAGLPINIPLPFRAPDGGLAMVNISRWLPGATMADVDQNPSGFVPEALFASGPLMLAAELLLNKVAFTDKPIHEQSDTGWQAIEKTAGWFYRSIAPNAVWIPGSWAQMGVWRSIDGQEDAFGRPYDPMLQLARGVGIKVWSHDRIRQRRRVMQEMRFKDRAFGVARNRIIRQMRRKAISASTARDRIQAIEERRRTMMTEYRQRLTGRA